MERTSRYADVNRTSPPEPSGLLSELCNPLRGPKIRFSAYSGNWSQVKRPQSDIGIHQEVELAVFHWCLLLHWWQLLSAPPWILTDTLGVPLQAYN